jgi:hypothetical protein
MDWVFSNVEDKDQILTAKAIGRPAPLTESYQQIASFPTVESDTA